MENYLNNRTTRSQRMREEATRDLTANRNRHHAYWECKLCKYSNALFIKTCSNPHYQCDCKRDPLDDKEGVYWCVPWNHQISNKDNKCKHKWWDATMMTWGEECGTERSDAVADAEREEIEEGNEQFTEEQVKVDVEGEAEFWRMSEVRLYFCL